MKIYVTGSQNITRKRIVYTILDKEIPNRQNVTIITGDRKGVEELSKFWSRLKMVPVEEYIPRWGKYGRSARELSIDQAVKECDKAIVIWNGKEPSFDNVLTRLKISGKIYKVYIPESKMKNIEKENAEDHFNRDIEIASKLIW